MILRISINSHTFRQVLTCPDKLRQVPTGFDQLGGTLPPTEEQKVTRNHAGRIPENGNPAFHKNGNPDFRNSGKPEIRNLEFRKTGNLDFRFSGLLQNLVIRISLITVTALIVSRIISNAVHHYSYSINYPGNYQCSKNILMVMKSLPILICE